MISANFESNRLMDELSENLKLNATTSGDLPIHEVSESEKKFRTIFNKAPVGISVTDSISGRIYEANQRYCEITGISLDKAAGPDWMSITHPDDLAKDIEHMNRLNSGEVDEFSITKRYIRPDGETTWIEMTVIRLDVIVNQNYCHLCIVNDITDRKRMEDELRMSRELFKTVSEFTHDWIYLISPEGNFIYVSPSSERFTGYTPDEFMDNPGLFLEIIHPSYRDMMKLHLKSISSADSTDYDEIEFPIRKKNGDEIWLGHACTAVYDEDGNYLGRRASNSDISERKRFEEALRYELYQKNDLISKLKETEEALKKANEGLLSKNEYLRRLSITDTLTGLKNRRYFEIKANEEIERSNRYSPPISMIILDLDHFKTINDTFGHDVGDDALIFASGIIKNCLRKTDIISRWGGEEFSILMPQTSLNGAVSAAEKIRSRLESHVHPVAGRLTASLGVTEHLKSEPFDSWQKRTDLALYKAKEKGRNRVIACEKNCFKKPLAHAHIVWNTDWECGVDIIDAQHREMLEAGNELIELYFTSNDADSVADGLTSLIDHIEQHFSDEEIVLRETSYPDSESHKEKHSELMKKAREFEASFKANRAYVSSIFSFLIDELIINHLLKEDMKFFSHLKQTEHGL